MSTIVAELGSRNRTVIVLRRRGRLHGGERVAARRRLLVRVPKRQHVTAVGPGELQRETLADARVPSRQPQCPRPVGQEAPAPSAELPVQHDERPVRRLRGAVDPEEAEVRFLVESARIGRVAPRVPGQ